MALEIVKQIYDAGRKRRVDIFRRDDGTFGFEEWYFSEAPREMCWCPLGGHSISFSDSPKTAVREVRERVPWLSSHWSSVIARPDQFKEIHLESPDGQSLTALVNGELAWLMYLRAPDDPGFHSINPDYDGPADSKREYVLDNGQRDEYPASWALPVARIEDSLAYFERENAPPPFIVWHDNSGRRLDFETR